MENLIIVGLSLFFFVNLALYLKSEIWGLCVIAVANMCLVIAISQLL